MRAEPLAHARPHALAHTCCPRSHLSPSLTPVALAHTYAIGSRASLEGKLIEARLSLENLQLAFASLTSERDNLKYEVTLRGARIKQLSQVCAWWLFAPLFLTAPRHGRTVAS